MVKAHGMAARLLSEAIKLSICQSAGKQGENNPSIISNFFESTESESSVTVHKRRPLGFLLVLSHTFHAETHTREQGSFFHLCDSGSNLVLNVQHRKHVFKSLPGVILAGRRPK